MIYIFVACCLGAVTAMIAHSKGRPALFWFFYGALVAIVAIPHVLLIGPDGRIRRRDLAVDLPGARTDGGQAEYRKCPFCAESVRIEAIKCRFCGEAIPALAGPRYAGGVRLDDPASE